MNLGLLHVNAIPETSKVCAHTQGRREAREGSGRGGGKQKEVECVESFIKIASLAVKSARFGACVLSKRDSARALPYRRIQNFTM